MEDRKLKEIEHSKNRREILQGFERLADTHAGSQINDLESLVSDKELFDYHFSNMKYYSVTEASERFKHEWLSRYCSKGKILLDFACGNGENGIYGALAGAEVFGIDISPEGIENSKKIAQKMGVGGQCRHEVMDGEKMLFDDNFFDVAVEYGALHHVDLDAALGELARVLKPDAKMICIEALRHNPLIHAYRKRTPHLRTEWEVEHILGVESLDVMERYFSQVNVRFFHLSALALVPLRKTFLFPILLPIFNAIDSVLLSTRLVGKYGWIMSIELSGPRK